MAFSEGIKDFVEMLKNTINPSDEETVDDDPFGFGGEYQADGNAALEPREKTPLDSMFPTHPVSRPSGFGSRREKVVPIQSADPYKTGEVTVVEPRSFSESAQIVKKLMDKKTIILHLDLLDKEQSQRTIDFICGASHALGGAVQKVSDAVVIFTPSTVALSVENATLTNKFAESLWNKPL